MFKKSIIQMLNISTLCIILVFSLIFSSVFLIAYSRTFLQQSLNSLGYIDHLIDSTIIGLSKSVEAVVKNISAYKDTGEFLTSSSNSEKYYQKASVFARYVDGLLSSNNRFSAIMIYNREGKKVIHSGSLSSSSRMISEQLDENIMESLRQKGYGQIWQRNLEENGAGIRVFVNLFNPSTLEHMGTLEVNISNSAVISDKALTGDFEYKSFFVGQSGNIIWAKDAGDQTLQQVTNLDLSQPEGYTLDRNYLYRTISSVTDYGLIITAMPTSELQMRRLGYLFTILSVLVLLFISMNITMRILNKRILRPLIQLSEIMERYGTDTTQAELAEVNKLSLRQDEIGKLAVSLSKLMKSVHNSIQVIQAGNNSKRVMELELLMSQIKPHFLYNTIEMICGMALLGKNEEVFRTAKMLGTFYRSTLSQNATTVSIAKELMHIESYLGIMEQSFDNSFVYTIDCKEEYKSMQVLHMLLQPIAENAVLHGIRKKQGGGVLKIRVEVDQAGVIHFFVNDNGAGMTEEQIAAVYTIDSASASGFGIMNVDERIKLFYGKEYGVSITSVPGQGTTVEIRVPQL